MNNNIMSEIKGIASKLKDNYSEQKLFDMEVGEKMPNRDEIISIIKDLRRLSFPGFFGNENMAFVSKDDFAGNLLATVYEKLYKQIKVAFAFDNRAINSDELENLAQEKSLEFLSQIPVVQSLLLKDVDAYVAGDPAANSKEDIIFSYPGLYAIMVYRYAHILYTLKVPYIPRIMTEQAHGKTGIDINPGASIGEYFFIDHGTGIVIGETTIIGNRVKIYQGVTLGALSTRKGQELSGVKRHPTIEDNVVIYSNASVLGGETVIGEGSVIAGNTFITTSIPKNTKVASTMPELLMKTK